MSDDKNLNNIPDAKEVELWKVALAQLPIVFACIGGVWYVYDHIEGSFYELKFNMLELKTEQKQVQRDLDTIKTQHDMILRRQEAIQRAATRAETHSEHAARGDQKNATE